MASEPIMSQPGSGNTLAVPSSPMQPPPMQDSSTSPQRGRPDGAPPANRDQPPMGYPGYGGQGSYPQPPYPPQGPYGGPYGPPGSGYPPPGGQPYGYPPPMHSPYPYPGYGAPPPGYGYGSGGAYPTQQAQSREEGSSQKKQQRQEGEGKKGKKSSPTRSRSDKTPPRTKSGSTSGPNSEEKPATSTPPPPAVSTKLADDLETARLRAAASTDSGMVEVDPMRTDFHFFVRDSREKLEEVAEVEVRRSTDNTDKFLLFSNLNTRLLKAWEDATQEERDEYMLKEEEDRRRFMNDEEIASRHCATLTARAKSPKSSDRGEKKDGSKTPEINDNTIVKETTPPPVKQEEPAEAEAVAEEDMNEESKKRSSPTNELNGTHPDESPSKKSRSSFDQETDEPTTDSNKEETQEEEEEPKPKDEIET